MQQVEAMEVAAYPVSMPSSTPTATNKLRPIFGTPASSDRIPIAVLNNNAGGDAETSDSAVSSADVTPISSSTAGATSYSAALLWHPEDDTNVDQDDGWQLVGSKSGAKGTHQHTPCSSTASTASSSKCQVCGRCGMRGHLASRCKQPHCSKCNRWWHTEEECARSCSTCGSLDHRVCGSSLCKSYKCRECGLYGHVYAECPNIRCNLCSEIGHKALDCPSIVCNMCKQKGHKAVNCPNPRHVASSASKPSTAGEVQLHLATPVSLELQQCSSSCSSVASPLAASSPASTAAAVMPRRSEGGPAASSNASAAAAPDTAASNAFQQDVPLVQHPYRPSNLAEQQQLQQQQSKLLGKLFKIAPELAISCLDDSSRLQALYAIEPQYLNKLLQGLSEHSPEVQCSQLQAAVSSAQRQLQVLRHQQPTLQQQPAQLMTPTHQQQHLGLQHSHQQAKQRLPLLAGQPQQQRQGLTRSTPASPAAPSGLHGEDAIDATQGIKPGDLAPQHARVLQEEFGDMLPSRWQQLPSWRQLEARLSFPDGNYVQRRLQFREKRRQLQLLTLQMRAAVSGRTSSSTRATAAAAAASGSPATRSAISPVVSATPAASSSPLANGATGCNPSQQQQSATTRVAGAPCSYAAALAGARTSSAAVGSPGAHSSSGDACRAGQPSSSPFAGAGIAAAAVVAPSSGVAVCSRCGMLGHTSADCVQPHCSRCHLWWHTEAQCNSACQFCGSLGHSGDAEQPASCKSFRCKACKMFGHTATICPHVQLHQQQLQRQSSSLSNSSLLPPASPLSSKAGGPGSSGGGAQSLSNGGSDTSSICPPDSPGLGQHGVKPKDLLPEHARALQDEFPNALPPGWQQMGSWRMVEERLRVVAVEGAVFSKRRQMWRDRRKHYQALTAQALAAAARSAASAARGAAAGVDGNIRPAVASSVGSNSFRADSGASSPNGEEQQREAEALHQQRGTSAEEGLQSQSAAVAEEESSSVTQQSTVPVVPAQQPELQQQQADQKQQQQPQSVKPQEKLQKCPADDPVIIPEWQQQQGSLFSLVDPAPGSSLHLEPAGPSGSAFSCDASFCCSTPVPIETSALMLSSMTDSFGCSGNSTPVMPVSGNNSSVATPAGLAAMPGRSSLGAAMSSPLPASAPCGTPVPTPRSAAGPASTGRGGYGAMPADMAKPGPYSPMPNMHNAGMMRSPLGYPGPPSSPMDMQNAAAAAVMAAAGRGPPTCTAGMPAPSTYHMMIAQRQNQLQQQLMLQGRYTRPMDQPGLASPQQQQQQQQQIFLQMQMQQQAQAQQVQHQMRMHRQARMDQAYMLQQQQRQHQQYKLAQQKPGLPGLMMDDTVETGELDDKLGVLGVLGLQ